MNPQPSITKTETKLDISHGGTLKEKISQFLKLLEEEDKEIEGTPR